jgi:ribosome-associated translation inhibitor RaiA
LSVRVRSRRYQQKCLWRGPSRRRYSAPTTRPNEEAIIPYRDESYDLAVQFEAHNFVLGEGDKVHFEEDLDQLATVLGKAPAATLHVDIHRHPREDTYHVKMNLRITRGRSLFTGERSEGLSRAFKSCVRKLVKKLEKFRGQFERRRQGAADTAPRVQAAAEPPVEEVAEAVRAGDYRRFREIVGDFYEIGLEKRIGRRVERYPEAAALLGDELLISEIVEEVILNAFERFEVRPRPQPLSEWLEQLIDPSIRELLDHPETERENVAFIRTLMSS